MRLSHRYLPIFLGVFAFATLVGGVTLDWQESNAVATPVMTTPDRVDPSTVENNVATTDKHAVTFATVPEINPGWSAVGSCLVAAALILRHSAKFRKYRLVRQYARARTA